MGGLRLLLDGSEGQPSSNPDRSCQRQPVMTAVYGTLVARPAKMAWDTLVPSVLRWPVELPRRPMSCWIGVRDGSQGSVVTPGATDQRRTGQRACCS
jgi:hypothetical protein